MRNNTILYIILALLVVISLAIAGVIVLTGVEKSNEDKLLFEDESLFDTSASWTGLSDETEKYTGVLNQNEFQTSENSSESSRYNNLTTTSSPKKAEEKIISTTKCITKPKDENLFTSLPKTFIFTSGVGAWSTDLELNSDGTFNAYFHDADSGVRTMYVGACSGKFSTPQKISSYSYSMHLESFEEKMTGEDEYYEDELKYVPGETYGFENAKNFIIYLPGTKISDIPEECLDWLYRTILYSHQGDRLPEDSYVIYCPDNGNAFVCDESH